MDASDWIAVSSAGIAVLAFGVSLLTLRLQQAGAKAGTQQQFDELVHQLWLALGKAVGYPGSPQQAPGGTMPSASAAMGEIQTFALQADELLNPPADEETSRDAAYRRLLRRLWVSSNDPPVAGWFDVMVLATSFAQVWDVERARYYWELAGQAVQRKDARIHSSAKIFTLRSVGMFYYASNTAEDLKQARDTFKSSLAIVDLDANGPDLTHGMNSDTLFLQAQQEDMLGNTAEAARRLREAWDLVAKMKATWRRQQSKFQFASFVAFGTYYESDPGRFGPHGGLPQEIAEEVAKLQGAQQQQPAVQQMMAAAWQQGFMAGQHVAVSQNPAGSRGWIQPGIPTPPGAPGSPSPQAIPGQPAPGLAAAAETAAAQPPYLY
jgi:hypothetical protein